MITINNTSGIPPNNFLTQLLVNSDPDITSRMPRSRSTALPQLRGISTTARGSVELPTQATGVNNGTVTGGQTLVATLTISALTPMSLDITGSQVHWQNTCNGTEHRLATRLTAATATRMTVAPAAASSMGRMAVQFPNRPQCHYSASVCWARPGAHAGVASSINRFESFTEQSPAGDVHSNGVRRQFFFRIPRLLPHVIYRLRHC